MPEARIPGPAGRQLPSGAVSGQLIRSAGPLDREHYAKTRSYDEFRRAVLASQIRRAMGKGRRFIGTLADGELEAVEPSCKKELRGALMKLRPIAAQACRELLKAARAQLQAEQAAGNVQAKRVEFIGIHSAYRTNAEEKDIWDRNYDEHYYGDTSSRRSRALGGPHGEAALAILVQHILPKKAAPGFGNHSDGIAVDFGTQEGGIYHGTVTTEKNRAAWRRTWLHSWLIGLDPMMGVSRAKLFRFHPLRSEEWHWDYR